MSDGISACCARRAACVLAAFLFHDESYFNRIPRFAVSMRVCSTPRRCVVVLMQSLLDGAWRGGVQC